MTAYEDAEIHTSEASIETTNDERERTNERNRNIVTDMVRAEARVFVHRAEVPPPAASGPRPPAPPRRHGCRRGVEGRLAANPELYTVHQPVPQHDP